MEVGDLKLVDALAQVTPTSGTATFRCPRNKKPFRYGCYLHGDELFIVCRDGSLLADARTPYAKFHTENDDWEVLPFER